MADKMRVLIIKLGAKGDVLRSTVILRALNKRDEVYWITKEDALPLLEGNPYIFKMSSNIDDFKDVNFDLVLNLQDDEEGCMLLNNIRYRRLEGFYLDNGKVVATDSAREWWAMSINGGEDRDYLKKANRKPMQHFFLKLLGKEFNGEEYVLNFPEVETESDLIGLEPNVGDVWPTKKWGKFAELKKVLEDNGLEVVIFSYKNNLKDYINEIARCSVIVSGDSLPMHIALALKKNAVALFGPTSVNEIYDYGRLKKIVTPVECRCCYKRKCDKSPNCMDLISVEEVAKAVMGFRNRGLLK